MTQSLSKALTQFCLALYLKSNINQILPKATKSAVAFKIENFNGKEYFNSKGKQTRINGNVQHLKEMTLKAVNISSL